MTEKSQELFEQFIADRKIANNKVLSVTGLIEELINNIVVIEVEQHRLNVAIKNATSCSET